MRKLVVAEVVPVKWGPETKLNRHLVKPLNDVATLQHSMADFIKKITPELTKIPQKSRQSIYKGFTTIFKEILDPLIATLKEYSPQKTSSMRFLSSAQIDSLLGGMLKGKTKRVSYLKIISRYLDTSFVNTVNSWFDMANKIFAGINQARQFIPPERYQRLHDFMKSLNSWLNYLKTAVNI